MRRRYSSVVLRISSAIFFCSSVAWRANSAALRADSPALRADSAASLAWRIEGLPRYDLNVQPHVDIRCAGCGEVSEIPGVQLGELEERIRNNTPFEVTYTTMVVEGLCPACRAGELSPGLK